MALSAATRPAEFKECVCATGAIVATVGLRLRSWTTWTTSSALFCLKFNFMSESQRIHLQKQVLPLSIWTASWWHHSLGPGHFVLIKQWWQDWATSTHLCVFWGVFLHFWAPWCRQFPSGGYASNQNSESSHVKDPDCSAWMWRTGGSPSHRPSSPSTPFANAFCGLLTRWINPKRI